MSLAITILGAFATIVFGGLSVFLFLKRGYQGKLVYWEDSYIGLFNSIVRNLEDLAITYKGQPVSENLVLVKGCLANVGRIDITPEMVEQALAITLPTGYKWRTAKIVRTSPNVKTAVTTTDRHYRSALDCFDAMSSSSSSLWQRCPICSLARATTRFQIRQAKSYGRLSALRIE